MVAQLEPDLRRNVDWGRKGWFQWWRNFFRLTGVITLVLLMWKQMDLSLRKNHLLRCWGYLSLLNWIGALTFPMETETKTSSKQIIALVDSMKFTSPEVALYLYKSIIQPGMEYCCHAWADAWTTGPCPYLIVKM